MKKKSTFLKIFGTEIIMIISLIVLLSLFLPSLTYNINTVRESLDKFESDVPLIDFEDPSDQELRELALALEDTMKLEKAVRSFIITILTYFGLSFFIISLIYSWQSCIKNKKSFFSKKKNIFKNNLKLYFCWLGLSVGLILFSLAFLYFASNIITFLGLQEDLNMFQIVLGILLFVYIQAFALFFAKTTKKSLKKAFWYGFSLFVIFLILIYIIIFLINVSANMVGSMVFLIFFLILFLIVIYFGIVSLLKSNL